VEWRPNNSPEAVAHLLLITGTTHVIVSDNFASKLQDAVDSEPGKLENIRVIPQPNEGIYRRDRGVLEPWEYPLAFDKEMELPFVVIHSSGSTGFPSVRCFIHIS